MDSNTKNLLNPSLNISANRSVRLNRSSSPDLNIICEHCQHDHAQLCCMYIYDDLKDIQEYATFKQDIDEPLWVNTEKDDLKIGGTTPHFFPNSTETDPAKADQKIEKFQSLIYFREYIWPVLMPPDCNINYRTDSSKYPSNYKTPAPCSSVHQYGMPFLYFNPIIREVTIPAPYSTHRKLYGFPPEPQIIESHSYLPIYPTTHLIQNSAS